MTTTSPLAAAAAPLVVFDFDNTLYRGDSGGDLLQWLLRRSVWRVLAALIASTVLLPLLAFLPTRRSGISGYLWIGTLGLKDYRDLNALIKRYVADRTDYLRGALLPIALAELDRHLQAGDRVVIATGAPPELAHAILALAARQDVPVVGSHEAPWFGGLITVDHCHNENKLRCLERDGYGGPIAIAYSDSKEDLPLLTKAQQPVVVNPKASSISLLRRSLPPGTQFLNWGINTRAGDPLAANASDAMPSRPAA
ncbi:MAG: haloacid dehalogenase-like hydrolase [Luteimonas sp.]